MGGRKPFQARFNIRPRSPPRGLGAEESAASAGTRRRIRGLPATFPDPGDHPFVHVDAEPHSAASDGPPRLGIDLLGEPVGRANHAEGLGLDPDDRGEQVDAAKSRDRGDGDRHDRAAGGERQADRVPRTELVEALRLRVQRAAEELDGIGERIEEPEGEWIAQGVDRPHGNHSLIEVGWIARLESGVAQPRPEDADDRGFAPGPPDPRGVLPVHQSPVAAKAGGLDREPAPQKRGVGFDLEKGGVARRPGPSHQSPGDVVEIGLIRRRLRLVRALGRGRAGQRDRREERGRSQPEDGGR